MSQFVRGAGRLFAVTAVTVAAALLPGSAALGACHAFTVELDPATADEGTTVTVTIERDAALNPSSVRVRTVDGTATGGADYTELDERVSFTTGTEQTRMIEIRDDAEAEEDETFRVELSDGEGCTVNPDFTYDAATVTIADDDAVAGESPSPSPGPPSPTGGSPSPSPTAAPSPAVASPSPAGASPTPSRPTRELASPSPSPTEPAAAPPAPTPTAVARGDDDGDGGGGGGLSGLQIGAAAGLAAALAGIGAVIRWLRREA